jgi:hypothetical protein
MTELHPYYQTHRPAMEEVMRRRIDLAQPWLAELELGDPDALKRDIMNEFELVLHQIPYVGGADSRMTDFFMRLIGFMAMGRALRKKGVAPKLIRDVALETYKADLLSVPEAERREAGRRFMSDENRALVREQAAASRAAHYRDAFVYDFVAPGPNDNFDFGVDYRACGFCKFAEKYGDQDILPSICGLDFVAYETRGIRLERTQTLAGGATHCNFRFTSMNATDAA